MDYTSITHTFTASLDDSSLFIYISKKTKKSEEYLWMKKRGKRKNFTVPGGKNIFLEKKGGGQKYQLFG